MNLQVKREKRLARGLYVHVPFCARPCDFCAFYQEAPQRRDILRYLDGVARELDGYGGLGVVDTVFWGGGTPGLLAAPELRRLAKQVRERMDGPPMEWTVEMAPSTVKADKVAALLEMGVTRVSMGVQSFDERWLDALGRSHGLEQIDRAIEVMRREGVTNLNLDLIFAIPGQSVADWERDLAAAVARGPEHISTYCLTFEDDTALWVKLRKGAIRKASEEEEVEFFSRAREVLGASGYAPYEVSNFARPGHECVHNLNTWRMQEWIGIGPAAASQFGGRRYANPHSLDAWIAGLEAGVPAYIDVMETTPQMLATDSLVFGLRMEAGVCLDEIAGRFPEWDGAGARAFIDGLCAEGLAERSGPHGAHVCLTDAGRLLADRIGSELLAL